MAIIIFFNHHYNRTTHTNVLYSLGKNMYSLSLTSISFVMEVCYLEHIVFCLNFLFLCQSMQATLQALITEYLRSLLTKILSYSL